MAVAATVLLALLAQAAPGAGAAAPAARAAQAAQEARESAAVARCATLRRHGQQQPAQACYQALASSADVYLRAEGDWGLGAYQQANDAFRQAVADHNGSALYRVRWGRLLQARFNDADAEGLFQEALQRDASDAEAYLGLALVSADGFDGKARTYARRAVALDPALAPAHELLAELALEDSDRATAASEADLALKAQPDELDAMAVHAALDVLAVHSPAAWLGKVWAINPGFGEADAIIADQLVLHRRYSEAVSYYQKAIRRDPQLWSAHSKLGITLMRLGQERAPEQQLQIAYQNGYRDAATVNTLRLLDSYKNFEYIHDGPILLKLDKTEAAVLAPYYDALVQRAMASYGAKYGMTLPEQTSGHGTYQVQVEAYPNHADFAVRSIGLPGLGALGVTFGQVVAMDSPSARPPGEFNWASTLWHEMNHVYVLTMTHHLVPRWFAEGLAVHEEGVGDPEWAMRPTPDDLAAITGHQLLPVAELDSGFVHPTYPSQVEVSYYQAGRICDYIKDRWGGAKLVDMVHDYSAPTTTAAVIEKEFAMTPQAFDRGFATWLMGKVGAEVTNFGTWRARYKSLAAAVEGHAPAAAIIPLAQQVIALYPDYVYDANAYGFLATAEVETHDNAAAIAALTEYEHRGGSDPKLLEELAGLDTKAGKAARAAAALNRINDIYPMRAADHRELGALWLRAGNDRGAIREFTAALALHPLDQAGAQYDLARADFAAGQLDAAQSHVIAALVAAHDYRPAQKLLVSIMAAKQKQQTKGPS